LYKIRESNVLIFRISFPKNRIRHFNHFSKKYAITHGIEDLYEMALNLSEKMLPLEAKPTLLSTSNFIEQITRR
jgi:hypothetical protein